MIATDDRNLFSVDNTLANKIILLNINQMWVRRHWNKKIWINKWIWLSNWYSNWIQSVCWLDYVPQLQLLCSVCVSVGAVITLDSLENRKRIVAVHMFAFADDVNYALKVCEILFFCDAILFIYVWCGTFLIKFTKSILIPDGCIIFFMCNAPKTCKYHNGIFEDNAFYKLH